LGSGLLTDLYELNMAASYLRRGMDGLATFSLFVRKMPRRRGFLVVAGVEDCIDQLLNFCFDADDLDYLRRVIGYEDAVIDAFRRLRFTGDVWAIPEGRVALAGEPILEVTAPIAEAQLVETIVLNQLTFQMAVASKAARCYIAARGRQLVDFSFRRTHSLDAGIAVARCCAIAGFQATSNVEAARRYGLIASGTMAHSFVEAFPSEADAFSAYAQDYPDRVTFLVDTYNTRIGVKGAINVIRNAKLSGTLAVRLDSGDLGALARQTRRQLDRAGLRHVGIFVSSGLDEFEIDRLVRSRAPITGLGVGTRVGTVADHPYLDTAYKLVEFEGRPVMKLSPAKTGAPGAKQFFRGRARLLDTIGLREERAPRGSESVLEPVVIKGERVQPREAVEVARQRFIADLALLPRTALQIDNPVAPVARISPALRRLTAQTRRNLKPSRARL